MTTPLVCFTINLPEILLITFNWILIFIFFKILFGFLSKNKIFFVKKNDTDLKFNSDVSLPYVLELKNELIDLKLPKIRDTLIEDIKTIASNGHDKKSISQHHRE
jgi:hypothetical protein